MPEVSAEQPQESYHAPERVSPKDASLDSVKEKLAHKSDEELLEMFKMMESQANETEGEIDDTGEFGEESVEDASPEEMRRALLQELDVRNLLGGGE